MNILSQFSKKIYNKLFFSRKFFYSTFNSFIGILFGFFVANAISTILGQTGDWGIMASGLLVAFVETINRIMYSNKKKFLYEKRRKSKWDVAFTFINNVKIGIIYGFFVEAFKLGS